MPDSLVALRTALADAWLGDTHAARQVFGSGEAAKVFDKRLIDLLLGLGQGVVTDPSSISGEDLAGLLREISATSQAERIAFIQAIKADFIPPSCAVAGDSIRVSTRLGAPGPSQIILQAPLGGDVGAAELRCAKTSPDTFLISGSGGITPMYAIDHSLLFLDEYLLTFPAADPNLCINELASRIGNGNGHKADFQLHYAYVPATEADPNGFYKASAPMSFVSSVFGMLAICARGPFFPSEELGALYRPIPNFFEFSASIVLPSVS